MKSPIGSRCALPFAFAAAVCGACKPSTKAESGDAAPTAANSPSAGTDSPAASGKSAGAAAGSRPSGPGPYLAANTLAALVRERPDPSSPPLGYLRLGAIVTRSAEPAGIDRCPKGWYAIRPRGYVCIGKGGTLDLDEPIVRASATRPNLDRALPYPYAFVRAVAPQYLRVPTADEQYKTEFKLRQHLAWWGRHASEVDQVRLGANDVAVDERGVPRETASSVSPEAGARPVASGSSRPSTALSVGELLGGQSDQDILPFWLEGGRRIPNIAPLLAPPTSRLFAERVRRHTGLALVGSFVTGPESLDRRFAVTVDLRLVPADKLKPDTASMFHGVAVTPEFSFPLAFVRPACDPEKVVGCARAYDIDESGAHPVGSPLAYRSVVKLTGKRRLVDSAPYHEMADGHWIRTSDASIGDAPSEWPPGAKSGKKWIEVSILAETLVLWEGQTPVYFTLVSAGQDGLRDPKTSKSTPLGTFRIFNKQITATMDSNERAAAAGAAPSQSVASASAPPSAGASPAAAVASVSASRSDSRAATSDPKGDADETDKPNESPFELRDVPYVQYFESGYALHAAYWHDAFGTARSHGCVNLSPIDARRVFVWTDPSVPEGWHGVSIGVGQGTLVVIHK